MSTHIDAVHQRLDRDYEIELSVDETDQPTTLAEHFIIADQCLRRGMKLISLAPRFVGDFEKGIDYIGDLDALQASLNDHASIAGNAWALQTKFAFPVRIRFRCTLPSRKRRRAGSM